MDREGRERQLSDIWLELHSLLGCTTNNGIEFNQHRTELRSYWRDIEPLLKRISREISISFGVLQWISIAQVALLAAIAWRLYHP